MPVYHDYPVTLHHPGYAPAVLAVDTGRMYNGDHVSPKGSPVRFPPVTVNSLDQEEEYQAKGYTRLMNAKQAEKNFIDAHAVRNTDDYNGFEEYPKWVNGVICEDEDEEAAALARPVPKAEDVEVVAASELQDAHKAIADLREELALMNRSKGAKLRSLKEMKEDATAEAEALGIKVDGRWSLDRLLSEIEAAPTKEDAE